MVARLTGAAGIGEAADWAAVCAPDNKEPMREGESVRFLGEGSTGGEDTRSGDVEGGDNDAAIGMID